MDVQRVWLLLLSFSTISCVFQLDEDPNFREVNKNVVVPGITITTNFADDTIAVFEPIQFEFSVEGLEAGRAFEILVFAGSTSQEYTTTSGTFNYNPNGIKGFQVLTLQVYVKSQTGSLVDKLDLERAYVQQTWVLDVDTEAPQKLTFSGIKRDKGSLRVDWQLYDRENFFSYVFTRKSSTIPLVQSRIKDATKNFYYDSLFVGGTVEYTLAVETLDGKISPVEKVTYTDNELPRVRSYELLAEPFATSKVVITGSRYPANVKKVDVYEFASQNPNASKVIFTTTNPSDTVFTFQPLFGEARVLGFTITGKDYNSGNRESVVGVPYGYLYGESILDHKQILFSDINDRFFLYDGARLSAFTLSENALVKSIDMNPVSVNMSYQKDLLLAGFANRVEAYDARTLQLQWTEDIAALIPPDNSLLGVGLASDGKLVLSIGDQLFPQHSNGPVKIYDRQTKAVTRTISEVSYGNMVDMSADGAYLAFGYNGKYLRMFHLAGDVVDGMISAFAIDPIAPLQANFRQCITSASTYDNALGMFSTVFAILEVADGSLLAKYKTDGMAVTWLDVERQTAVGRMVGSRGRVVKYLTNEILWEGPLSTDELVIHGDYIYADNARLKIQP